ncbi:hypothetical protein LXL04_003698 [Taraxacum kok-saghyz]
MLKFNLNVNRMKSNSSRCVMMTEIRPSTTLPAASHPWIHYHSAITWKLGTLVSIVRQHISKYLPELLSLIAELWSSFSLTAANRSGTISGDCFVYINAFFVVSVEHLPRHCIIKRWNLSTNPVAVVEALIHINNQLHQHELYSRHRECCRTGDGQVRSRLGGKWDQSFETLNAKVTGLILKEGQHWNPFLEVPNTKNKSEVCF